MTLGRIAPFVFKHNVTSQEGAKEEKADEDDDDDEEGEKDDVPKPDYKPPVVIPKEDNRVGVNKYVYFVCNNPGWCVVIYSVTYLSSYHKKAIKAL